MKVALGQINPTVGDVEGNTARMLEMIEQARHQEAALIVFPELATVGYPPKDLLLRQDLIQAMRVRRAAFPYFSSPVTTWAQASASRRTMSRR